MWLRDSNQLIGEIPPELGNLVNLEGLGLNNNQLSGEIPPELGNLTSLELLFLNNNLLNGEIPSELGNLDNLIGLGLNDNQLSGCVPSSLGRLDMDRSDLGGLRFCPSTTDREALVALYNATGGSNWNSNDNWLSAVPIGEWFGVTTDDNGHVTELSLAGNQLSGEIPRELGNFANLETLSLAGLIS